MGVTKRNDPKVCDSSTENSSPQTPPLTNALFQLNDDAVNSAGNEVIPSASVTSELGLPESTVWNDETELPPEQGEALQNVVSDETSSIPIDPLSDASEEDGAKSHESVPIIIEDKNASGNESVVIYDNKSASYNMTSVQPPPSPSSTKAIYSGNADEHTFPTPTHSIFVDGDVTVNTTHLSGMNQIHLRSSKLNFWSDTNDATPPTIFVDDRGRWDLSAAKDLDSCSYDAVKLDDSREDSEAVTNIPGEIEASEPTKEQPKEPLDVVFCFDCTASMSRVIRHVQARISELTERLLKDIPDIRIGILAHLDYGCEPYVLQRLDFSDNVTEIHQFIQTVHMSSNSDFQECYELALHDIRTNFSWRSNTRKRLIMIGDSVPHELDSSRNKTNLDWEKETRLLRDELKVIIHSVQAYPQTFFERFWKALASLTGGRYLLLSDFTSVFDLIMGICCFEQGEKAIKAFTKEVLSRRNTDNQFSSCSSSVTVQLRERRFERKQSQMSHDVYNLLSSCNPDFSRDYETCDLDDSDHDLPKDSTPMIGSKHTEKRKSSAMSEDTVNASELDPPLKIQRCNNDD